MIMAEMAAFDNVKELTEMADDLATFVQRAAAIRELAWLQHFEQDGTDRRSPNNDDSAGDAVDRLLASY